MEQEELDTAEVQRGEMMRTAVILPYQGAWPEIHPTVFLAPGCVVVGNVTIGEHASIWFNTVVRGDVHRITIGPRTNVQDTCMLHVTWKSAPLVIGSDVTIGHGAVVHGCTIGDGSLVGIQSTILDHAEIGESALIAAGAVVRSGTVVPRGTMAAGVPAVVRRELTDEEQRALRRHAENYLYYISQYRAHGDVEQVLTPQEYFQRFPGGA